jgi:hypothetical protein
MTISVNASKHGRNSIIWTYYKKYTEISWNGVSCDERHVRRFGKDPIKELDDICLQHPKGLESMHWKGLYIPMYNCFWEGIRPWGVYRVDY